jgi:hypothetical protein
MPQPFRQNKTNNATQRDAVSKKKQCGERGFLARGVSYGINKCRSGNAFSKRFKRDFVVLRSGGLFFYDTGDKKMVALFSDCGIYSFHRWTPFLNQAQLILPFSFPSTCTVSQLSIS